MNAQDVWQNFRTPLVLLALVMLVVLGAVWGWREVVKPPAGARPNPCVVQPITDGQLRSEQVTVEVNNSGSKRGLAGQVATALGNQKFVVAQVGNAEGLQARDVVVIGAAADAPEVTLVAAQFATAEVRADPDRSDHRVLVVLGDDFSGMADQPPATVDVDAATICLPALPSASTSPASG